MEAPRDLNKPMPAPISFRSAMPEVVKATIEVLPPCPSIQSRSRSSSSPSSESRPIVSSVHHVVVTSETCASPRSVSPLPAPTATA